LSSRQKRFFLLLPFLVIIALLSHIYFRVVACGLPTASRLASPSIALPLARNFTATPQTPTKMSAKEAVEKHIKESHVVVFSKSYCPYCRRAKALLKELNETPTVFELDEIEEGGDWQSYLGDKTGQHTVPSIWIDGRFIGGSSDLDAKNRNGELKQILGGKL